MSEKTSSSSCSSCWSHAPLFPHRTTLTHSFKPGPLSLLPLSLPVFFPLFFTHNPSSLHSGTCCPSLSSFPRPSLQPGPPLTWTTLENWDQVGSSYSSSFFILPTRLLVLLLLKRQKNRKTSVGGLWWARCSFVDQKKQLHRVSNCPGSV